MKPLAYLSALIFLAGCNGPLPTADQSAQSAAGNKQSMLGRSVDKGEGVATDSYIQQINQAVPRDENGKAIPQTLDELKKSLHDYPAEMWVDGATSKPLDYDPTTGTVARAK